MQWELGTSAVLIHPESSLLNKTLTEVEFQNRYNAQVIGMRRNGEVLPDFKHAKLQASDSLLVAGSWESLDQLRRLNHEFIVLEEAKEQTEKVPAYRKAPIALTILAMLVAVSVLDLLPLTITVLLAALAAVFTRCMTMEDAYRSIHWNSIVLIAGLLPMADALQVTGGTEFIVDGLMGLLGSAPYSLMFTALFSHCRYWLISVEHRQCCSHRPDRNHHGANSGGLPHSLCHRCHDCSLCGIQHARIHSCGHAGNGTRRV